MVFLALFNGGKVFGRVSEPLAEVNDKPLQRARLKSGLKRTGSSKKDVAVVLAYFNGRSYVKDQLSSILEQRHIQTTVYIFDDHSRPSIYSNPILKELVDRCNVHVAVRTHNAGFAKNFLLGLAEVSDRFEYYAFSDQDDVWHEDKLEKAIAALEKLPFKEPALYCARTKIVDVTAEHTLGYSPLFNKPASFANALVQNIGGGNTMVFNKAAKNLILEATQDLTIVSHDWWCYQIVTGAGGYVVYDPEPCLKYRQHTNNLVGANTSWRARLLRVRSLLLGRFREWNDVNLAALSAQKHLLSMTNRRVLDDFIQLRCSSLLKRLKLFKRSGIYRQTLFGNLGLWLGVFLNKL